MKTLKSYVACLLCCMYDVHNYTDVDECTMMTDNCTEIELCQNRPGSFTCQCKEGYKRLSESCVGKYKIPLWSTRR